MIIPMVIGTVISAVISTVIVIIPILSKQKLFIALCIKSIRENFDTILLLHSVKNLPVIIPMIIATVIPAVIPTVNITIKKLCQTFSE